MNECESEAVKDTEDPMLSLAQVESMVGIED